MPNLYFLAKLFNHFSYTKSACERHFSRRKLKCLEIHYTVFHSILKYNLK